MSILILFLMLPIATTLCANTIGTPLTSHAKKVMMLGSGELGKEVVIELKRLGVEVIAVDRYDHAPAMQVADRSYVINMTSGEELRSLVYAEKPHLIVPEIEAIDTDMLIALEAEGFVVIPTARAAKTTMNRERIRRLAAEELQLKTSNYLFASTLPDYLNAVKTVGIPCVVKPVMSSSGKGQSVVRKEDDIIHAWDYAHAKGRTQNDMVIIEEFINFDYEITLLTIRTKNGETLFCPPIGHIQIDGDYRESWQPHPMDEQTLQKAQAMAKIVTDALGGCGIFGVELFIKGDEVLFSEVSPRPHDTGMVTLISQNLSEFALHVRAILGLPIPHITQYGPSASHALLVEGNSNNICFGNFEQALAQPNTDIRLFGKPGVSGKRRMGVGLARGENINDARHKAQQVVDAIEVTL